MIEYYSVIKRNEIPVYSTSLVCFSAVNNTTPQIGCILMKSDLFIILEVRGAASGNGLAVKDTERDRQCTCVSMSPLISLSLSLSKFYF
jgi:hypothetical protein